MPDGTLVRTFTGKAERLRVQWDGTNEQGLAVPPGRYDVKIEARIPGGDWARPARLRTRVEAP